MQVSPLLTFTLLFFCVLVIYSALPAHPWAHTLYTTMRVASHHQLIALIGVYL